MLETLCMSSMHDSVFWFVSAGYVLCCASQLVVASEGKIILLVQSQVWILYCYCIYCKSYGNIFTGLFFSVLIVNLRRKSLPFTWVNSHLQNFADVLDMDFICLGLQRWISQVLNKVGQKLCSSKEVLSQILFEWKENFHLSKIM